MGLSSRLEELRLIQGGEITVASPEIVEAAYIPGNFSERKVPRDMREEAVVPKKRKIVKKKTKGAGKGKSKKQLKGGYNIEGATAYLTSKGVPPLTVDAFIKWTRTRAQASDKSWLDSNAGVKEKLRDFIALFPEYADPEYETKRDKKRREKREKKQKEKEKEKEEGKDEKEEKEEKNGAPELVPVAPAAPPAGIKPVKGAFKLTEKEFGLIRTSSPRYEWKQLLKNFFSEMNITAYGKIPAAFIQDVNALYLKGEEKGSNKIDKLQAIISTHKPSVAPDAVPEAKTKSLVKPSKAVKKPRKGKKVKLLVIKKSKTRTLPKTEKLKKKPRSKKSKSKLSGGALKEVELVV